MRRIVKGKNDIFTLNPEWLLYCDLEKNKEENIDVYSLARYSHNEVNWECKNCGIKFKRKLSNIKDEILCNSCALKKGNNEKYLEIIKQNGSLKSKFPELAKEWHPTKNGDLTPEQVTSGSAKKVWWICDKGHEWEAVIGSRVGADRKCPICTNQKVLKGYNDLETVFPYLLKEWNYEKNDVSPDEIIARSGKKYWWICELGHEWKTSPLERSYGRGCPTCSSERSVSVGEKTILYYIQQNYSGKIIPNYRSEIIKNKELDIYLPDLNIGLEYDGVYFHTNKKRDLEKDKICKNIGIKVFHIAECRDYNKIENNYIYYNVNNESNLEWAIESVLDYLVDNKKVNVDISRDRISIYNLLEYSIKEQSLANRYPQVASEWDNEKNGKLRPDLVSYGSSKTVWWICEKGHSYQSIIYSRINGTGCPYCANQKILRGYNDLETLYPELVKEWDYKKNCKNPYEISPNSSKKYWWLCSNNHSWEISAYSRTHGSGCPYCARQKTILGYNDLKTVNPKLAKQWNKIKNINLSPEEVMANSHQKVWWICEKGHEWEAAVVDRNLGNGCPYCSNQKILIGYNDLATVKPELLKEWDYEKNIIKPTEVTKGTTKKAWWICEKGHSYETNISSRTKGTGCPICANKKILVGYNDLSTTNPNLLSEWDFEKNTIKPTEVTGGTRKKVWWKCPKCNNSWEATIIERTKGFNKCSNCNIKKRGKNPKKIIVQFDLNGNFIKEYDGIVDAANDLKISRSTIHKNLKGKSKQAAGYIWKYKD